jgi:hypothetical protein
MFLRERGCWIHLAQWQDFMSMEMNLHIAYNSENFLSCSATFGFSRRTHFHGVSLLVTKLVFVCYNVMHDSVKLKEMG